jgi:hypothetical protein
LTWSREWEEEEEDDRPDDPDRWSWLESEWEERWLLLLERLDEPLLLLERR